MKSFSGKVVPGERIGRTLGFPTANIDADAAVLGLAKGVYAADVRIAGDERVYRAMLNIGSRPTFAGAVCTVEAHLLDFSGDLYGKVLHVDLRRKLREERRFPNAEALKRQLAEDAAHAADD
ncbi:MAG: riboflavin kinase [Bacteroidales bacterium]|nr:riboflavin kinase [Bacteroidales bacterium]